jgi:hypothetical protein
MVQKLPPRYVPTLTQIVSDAERQAIKSTQLTSALAAESSDSAEPRLPDAYAMAQQLRAQLLAQTWQHVNAQLDRRIREVVAQLALEHAHRLFEEIQPAIETTITQVIDQAIQKALQEAKTYTP